MLSELETQRNIVGGRAASLAGEVARKRDELIRAAGKIAELEESAEALRDRINVLEEEAAEREAALDLSRRRVEDLERAAALDRDLTGFDGFEEPRTEIAAE